MANHQINRQTFELSLSDDAAFHTVANTVGETMQQKVVPALSDIFDDITLMGQHLIIDKLEIDLGVIKFEDLSSMLADKLLHELKERLSAFKQYSKETSFTDLIELPQDIVLWQHWSHYLKNGRSVWNAKYTTLNREQWEQKLIDIYINGSSQNEISKIVTDVLNHQVAVYRLVNVFSEKFIYWLLELNEILTIDDKRLLDVFVVLAIQINEQSTLLPQLYKFLLYTKAARNSYNYRFYEMLRVYYLHFPESEWTTNIYQLVRNFDGKKIETHFPPWIVQWFSIKNLIANSSQTNTFYQLSTKELNQDILPQPMDLPFVVAEIFKKENVKNVELFPLQQLQEIISENNQVQKDGPTGIFIGDAGLVVVAAFLPMLFEKLELVIDGEFVSSVAQQTAAKLIAYLANGDAENADWQMILPKILAGLALEDIISADIFLTEEAMKEGEEMLWAVIKYWEALGDSSIEALREAFLKRDGKLTDENNEWHLLVQGTAIDLLLDRLPWSFSMIKHSWMKQLLITEWQGVI
ncbi:hypothetical protein DVR12_24190 [Chitinophaga silvatica]|uniref:Uncharacterized protein n=1 Tax=Chitinophaga silvatica TaxID=2282649 RepID=A0A3E1Y3S9_9BACT|nr:contractile injection system tape measure protein [Chitinophaga silvatica]RFS19334.1 hypothetical protein DVR12_24190 [Chitinophaga silvatica]